MKAVVKLSQVTNGLEYKGTLSMNGDVFTFNLKFGVHIMELDNQNYPLDRAEAVKKAMELFQFELKKSESIIPISDELFGFLVGVVGVSVVEFFNNEMTQDSNNSPVIGQLLDSESELSSVLGDTVSVSIGTSVTFDVLIEQIPIELI